MIANLGGINGEAICVLPEFAVVGEEVDQCVSVQILGGASMEACVRAKFGDDGGLERVAGVKLVR